jgi:2-polyprenyl-3-methyl-5-hydroxy-6-metoxy-1,4-benzoquinol methylase
MFNWTKFSDNPLDSDLLLKTQKTLHSLINFKKSNSTDFVLSECKDKKVLDIGIVEHAESFMQQANWKHRKIKEISSYCLGIDIIQNLIEKLFNLGYNVKCVDATSEINLEMKFDVVNIGDVIEHVNDPVNLLRFSGRHLDSNGKIIVSTPNPNFYLFLKSALIGKMYTTNLDHLRWITPCQALEIGRRANLELTEIVFFLPNNLSWIKRQIRKIRPELFSMTYYYVYQHTQTK